MISYSFFLVHQQLTNSGVEEAMSTRLLYHLQGCFQGHCILPLDFDRLMFDLHACFKRQSYIKEDFQFQTKHRDLPIGYGTLYSSI